MYQRFRFLRQAIQNQLQVSHHDAKHVVETVGNSASHPSQAFSFLCLLESLLELQSLFLCAFPISDIDADPNQTGYFTRRTIKGTFARRKPYSIAFRIRSPHFVMQSRFARCDDFRVISAKTIRVRLQEKVIISLSRDFIFLHPTQFTKLLIAHQVYRILIFDICVGRDGRQQDSLKLILFPQSLLRSPAFLFDTLALGDIVQDAMHSKEFTIYIVLDAAFKKHSEQRVVLAHQFQLFLKPSVTLEFCKSPQIHMPRPRRTELGEILTY